MIEWMACPVQESNNAPKIRLDQVNSLQNKDIEPENETSEVLLFEKPGRRFGPACGAPESLGPKSGGAIRKRAMVTIEWRQVRCKCHNRLRDKIQVVVIGLAGGRLVSHWARRLCRSGDPLNWRRLLAMRCFRHPAKAADARSLRKGGLLFFGSAGQTLAPVCRAGQ